LRFIVCHYNKFILKKDPGYPGSFVFVIGQKSFGKHLNCSGNN
jgi:hypothetical protein